MASLRLFFMISIIMLALDAVWLNVVGKPFYLKYLGHFFSKTSSGIHINYYAAGMVYLCLILGIMLFVMPKAQGYVAMAFIWGALFGFLCYGIYNFTNLAVIHGWPLDICLIDTAWGTFLCATTSALAQWLK